MKKIYLALITAFFLFSSSLAQTVIVAGADAATLAGNPYTTLNGAFTNINAAVQTGNIIITITGTTVEPTSANLNAGTWTSMSVIPVGVSAVTGNYNGALINFNGADNVTIDGLNAAGNALTITNTSGTGSAITIRFASDASNNTITRCDLLGSTGILTAASGLATVYFASGTTTGNDNNTISQCNISASATGTPRNAIQSAGFSAAVVNSNNTITGNNIFDFFHPDVVSCGISLNNFNSDWTITTNRFYQTATRTATTANTHNGINITSGSGYTISNNVIGFANAAGTGTTNMIGLTTGSLGGTFPSSFTTGGTPNALRYCGISCAFTAGGTVSSIQNNIIAGIALYTSSGASATNGILCGINITSGNVNIGTVTGNTIGSASGTNSIYAASTTVGAVIAGIFCTTTNTINIQNNTIGGIDVSGTTATQAAGFKGIDVAGTGIFNVSNNTVGNATANNIRTGYLLTGGNLSNTATTPTAASGLGVVRGIASTATGATLDISNNIVQGMQVSGTASPYTGISTTGNVATMNINTNQVGNAVTNAVTFPFVTSNTVYGISIFTIAPGTVNINNNSIYGITCAGANSVRGIVTSNGASLSTININNNSVTNNVIDGAAVSSPMYGITNSSVASILSITGNIIRTNSSTATTGGFTGIENTGAVINTISITNNQLGNAIGGAITFSAATTGTINAITNTNAASTATVNINSNSLDGFSVVNCGQIIFIQNTAGNAVAVNMNNNQLGTVTGSLISLSGVQTSSLNGIYNPSGNASMAVSIQNNDITGITHTATATGSQQYINCQAPVLSTNISNNTFSNLSINSSGIVYLILKGGIMASGTSSVVSNNSIVGSFNKTATGGIVYGYISGPASVNGSTITISDNDFSNVTLAGTGSFVGISEGEGTSAASGPTKTITGNVFNNIAAGSGSITLITIDKGAATNCSSNTFSNITGSGTLIGISIGTANGQGNIDCSSNSFTTFSSSGGTITTITANCPSVPLLNISSSIISGLSSAGAGAQITGISINSALAVNINDNLIHNVDGTGTGAAFATGIALFAGTTVNIYNNKVYDFLETGTGSGAPLINGIRITDGNTVNVYNNFVSDLRVATISHTRAVSGIVVSSTTPSTTYNLYYNSVYLNASSSGFNFGTAGIYHVDNASATTAALTMINNIVVNMSTPNGAGEAVAYYVNGSTLGNYSLASDHNLFYAGTPGPQHLIFYDGTNSDQTLAAFQARVSPRETNSISLMPNFNSITDLHLTAANCRIDGRGTPIGSVTTDIDAAVRNATTPDIGADEFTATTSTTLAGAAGSAVCEDRTVAVTGTTYRSNPCDIIAYVLPSGGAPVSGKVNVCVTLDATQQTFNGEPYVQRHFDIEPTTSNQTTTSATITLYFTDAEFVLYNSTNPVVWPRLPTAVLGNADPNRANLKVTQFHGAATTSPSSPGNYTGVRELIDPVDTDILWNGTYWAVTFNVTGFSGFYVHTNNFNAPLPIVVNYLTGHKQGSNHLLNWKVTCTSTARATMTLERSSDARNYSGIYTITADAARCQQPFDYTDADPLKSMNYYRLKIVDADGHVTYSTTVALLNAVKGFDIVSIAPNPVINDDFKLNVASAQSSKMVLAIFDMQGRLVNRQALSLIAGFNSMPVNVANLSPGTYTIQGIIAGDKSKAIRFVKQ